MHVLAMLSSTFISVLGLAAVTQATSSSCKSLRWAECEDIDSDVTVPYECATHAVPLDWTEPEKHNLTLQLLRIPAPVQPSRGSIQFNFGGPGAEARNVLLSLSPRLLRATGGVYDLVAFDPRGSGNTIPYNCSNDPLELFDVGIGILTQMGNSSAQAMAQLWAQTGIIAGQCYYHEQATGELVNTAFVARDMMSVVDALDEDGMLRYWGLSYGSTLGSTVAAMFPDRVDRLVIDGVQNVHEYYNGYAEIEQWSDADKAFSSIWSTCIEAGPELCTLAADYDDSSTLENDVWALMYELKEDPIAITSASHSFVLDYAKIKDMLVVALYASDRWTNVARAIGMMLKRETQSAEFVELLSSVVSTTAEDRMLEIRGSMATFGIRGVDRIERVQSLDELAPTLSKLEETSRLVGDVIPVITMTGTQWRFHAKERYTGVWANITTRHPLLIVGNTYDGITSLKSAHNASAIFQGSVVLEIEVYGHGSHAGPSKCGDEAIAAYFVNGTLPEIGTVCPVEVRPYQV